MLTVVGGATIFGESVLALWAPPAATSDGVAAGSARPPAPGVIPKPPSATAPLSAGPAPTDGGSANNSDGNS